MRRVTEYNEDGQTKELPKLDRGRRSHGCASYVDKENRIVMIFTTFVRRCNYSDIFQVLLVTGGRDGYTNPSTTEIQVSRSSEWKQVQSYPLHVSGLSGATINNIVYMTGIVN